MALPFGYFPTAAGAGLPYGGFSTSFGYQQPAYLSPYSVRGGFAGVPQAAYAGFGVAAPYQLQAAQVAQAQAQVQAQAQAQAAAEKSSGIKITYFDYAPTGLAECLRLALFVGGVPFEDERLSREEWEKNHKDKISTFGQLPVLTVGGKVLAQTLAQLIFIGGFTGLYPEDMWERARINEALFLGEDIVNAMRAGRSTKEEEKEPKLKEFIEKLPTLLGYVEKLLAETNTGFLAGPKLTVADIHMWTVLGFFEFLFPGLIPSTIFDKFPRTAEFRARIAALPRIAEWNNVQAQKRKDKEAAEKAKEAAKQSEEVKAEAVAEEKPVEQQQ